MTLAAGERAVFLAEGLDPARGGMERAVRATAEALARSGVEVEVFTPADRAGPELEGGARRIAVELPALPRALRATRLASALASRATTRSGARTIACGKLLDAELWWSHGGVHRAALLARTSAGRGGAAAFAARALRAMRLAEWAFLRLDAKNIAACREGRTRAVALSQRVRDDLASAGLDPARVAIVRNGVDHARFSPPTRDERALARTELARAASAPPGAPLLLHLAHDPRLKGLDDLLCALPRVPAARLVVAGAFDPRPWQRLATRHAVGDRVAFLGPVPDPLPLYRGADLLVHPTRYDPCSLVVLESIACALPAITTREDGASELLAGAGAIATELAPAIEHALSHREAHSAAAAAFRRPWEQVGQELLALL